MKVRQLSEHEVLEVLDAADIYAANAHYNKAQFEKYLGTEHYVWFGLYDMGICTALACCQKHPKAFVLVAELQSFISGHGYGHKLLKWILRKSSSLWLACDPTAGAKLLSFYQSFPELEEFHVNMSKWWNMPQSFFFKAANDKAREEILQLLQTFECS